MRSVMREIFSAKRQYATLPLFEFMRDETLSPEDRLAFYPCMAPFILAFGDLNKYVLRVEPAGDRYQALVNQHTFEDDHHWPWYLEDFDKLGIAQQRTTDALRWMYGDELRVNRMLMTRLAHLVYGASSVEKLVIIEAIEETGNVLFQLTAQLARRLEAARGIQLRYLGDFHFDLETGHAMGSDDHQRLAEIPLTDTQRIRCLRLVGSVFDLFEEWTQELLTYAQRELQTKSVDVESTQASRRSTMFAS